MTGLISLPTLPPLAQAMQGSYCNHNKAALTNQYSWNNNSLSAVGTLLKLRGALGGHSLASGQGDLHQGALPPQEGVEGGVEGEIAEST